MISDFISSFITEFTDLMDYVGILMPTLLAGAWVMVQLFCWTLLLSLPLGLPIALGSNVRFWPIRAFCRFYVFVFRGTPLLLQLYFFYFLLPIQFDIRLPALTTSIITFVLNYAAYFAEIYRSGIESMPVGQYEAAKVLGYSRVQTFFRIILPQVIKRVLPAVTNEMITLVKDTSLAFVLTVTEMFTIAKQIAAAQASVMPLMAAGVFYYIFNLVVAVVMEHVEKKLNYYRG